MIWTSRDFENSEFQELCIGILEFLDNYHELL